MTESEVSRLQQNQHQQNMDRFGALEKGHQSLMAIQIAQSASLARIEANTSGMPGLEARVKKLESGHDRLAGALGLATAIFTGWEFISHFFKK